MTGVELHQWIEESFANAERHGWKPKPPRELKREVISMYPDTAGPNVGPPLEYKGGCASYKRGIILLPMILLLVGGCSSLPAWLGGTGPGQLGSLINAYVAGTYTIEFKKNGQLLHTETWACTADPGHGLTCQKLGALTTSPDVSPVVK
jgi:hypothetical protein